MKKILCVSVAAVTIVVAFGYTSATAKVFRPKGVAPFTNGEVADVKAACGALGVAANEVSDSPRVSIVAGYAPDQFANHIDPNSNPPVNYGNHITANTFDDSIPGPQKLTGTWHLYESGAAWVHRPNTNHSVYVCN